MSRFDDAKKRVLNTLIDPVLDLLKETSAAVDSANREARYAKEYLEAMTHVWQHGPDFAAHLALSELWAALGVADQTAAMQRIRHLLHCESGFRAARDEASRLRQPDTTGQ